jgi:hypothetical protein
MPMTRDKLAGKAVRAAGRAVGDLEGRILAAEGRRSLKAKAHTVGKVARKALKSGLIAGGIVAAVVVKREVGKRRKLSE